MTRQFSQLIALGCLAIIVAVPVTALYLLVDIELFAAMARRSLNLPIRWQTVSDMQWYSLWLLSVFYVAIGVVGLYFLRRAFSNFAKGELFNRSNSRDLRLFAVFLFAQTVASILLSMHHPSGQKMLSISLGSGEVKAIALAMILWVMSDLLVSASKLEIENKQFI